MFRHFHAGSAVRFLLGSLPSLLTGCTDTCPTAPLHNVSLFVLQDVSLRDAETIDGDLLRTICDRTCLSRNCEVLYECSPATSDAGCRFWPNEDASSLWARCIPNVACGIGGRAAFGLQRVPECEPEIGPLLLYQAQSEFNSIGAFIQLARTLSELMAPSSLVARAILAAHDEARHTGLVVDLAFALGADRFDATWTPVSVPSEIVSFTIHNFVEGCVRETFAAVVALRQSRYSSHPISSDVFSKIASDEMSHAVLSWDVAEYLNARLDDESFLALRAAAARAIESLFKESCCFDRIQPVARSVLGLPSTSEAQAILRALDRCVWEVCFCDVSYAGLGDPSAVAGDRAFAYRQWT